MKRSFENVIFVLLLLPLIYFFRKPDYDIFNVNLELFYHISAIILITFGLVLRVYTRNIKFMMSHGGLVTTDIYGIVRNPMYVASFLIGLGLTLIVGNLFLIIGYTLLFFIIHNLIALREEKLLESFFGDEYLEYKKNVNRWIPKISKYKPEKLNMSIMDWYEAVSREQNTILGILVIVLFLFLIINGDSYHQFSQISEHSFLINGIYIVITSWVILDIVYRIVKKNIKNNKLI